MNKSTIGLLLLPGAGMGSWVWRDVVSKLSIPAVAVDYPRDNATAGMDAYVATAVEQANTLKTDKVVIVGHSFSGTIGLRVAEALGDRVAGYIGVAAILPANGGSFVSALPFPQKLIMPLIIRLAGTKPPTESIRKSYCNDLDEATTKEVLDGYIAETKQIYFDRSALPPQVPRLYIQTTKDSDFPIAMQDGMAKNLGAEQKTTIETGHLPMLAKPDELARQLNDFCGSL